MTNALRFKCRNCGCKTGPGAFKDVDAEFNSARPLCPPCEDAAELSGQDCEHCDTPAQYTTDAGPLCEDHYETYVRGYGPRE